MLRKHLILAILLLLCSGLFGQDRSRLDSAIIKLKAEGIDTFIVYNIIVYDFFPPDSDDNCIVENSEIYYLYWILKGSVCVVRVDNCYEYAPIVKLQSPFVKLFTANLKKVRKELIRPHTITQPKENGKKGKIRVNMVTDHSAYPNIKYITPTDTIYKVYDVYDLEKGESNGIITNESYKYNSSTYIVRLAELAEKETKAFTFMYKEKP